MFDFSSSHSNILARNTEFEILDVLFDILCSVGDGEENRG